MELSGDKILVIGAGDPRHIIKTLSREDNTDDLKIFILEQSLHVYCRQILLLELLREKYIDKTSRAVMYLEMMGNSMISEDTATWIRKYSSKLSQALSKQNTSFGPWDLSLLKEKEREEMEKIYKQWKTGSETGNKMESYWRHRQQRMLGERYEERCGVADMCYHMQLVERGGGNINKRDFIRWRETGIAFKVRDDQDQTDNVSLINNDGYWGDVGTGPFLCFGEYLIKKYRN